MTVPAIFTIVPNWNLKDDLGECLASLLAQSGVDQRILVVDNGSTDGSTEYVRQAFPSVKVLPLAENRGYAAGLNAGIQTALEQGAEYLFLLNNDTVVPADALSGLYSTLQAHADAGIVSPKILHYTRRDLVLALGDRRLSWAPLPLPSGYLKKDGPKYQGEVEFDYITGCALLVRAEVFRQIGLFDESYFMYYEDADFCWRTRQAGWRIFCNADAAIYHKSSLSSRKDRPASIRVRARNRVWFYRTHPHGPARWLTGLVIAAVAVVKSAGFLLRGESRLVGPYLTGLWEGWRTAAPAPYLPPIAQRTT